MEFIENLYFSICNVDAFIHPINPHRRELLFYLKSINILAFV